MLLPGLKHSWSWCHSCSKNFGKILSERPFHHHLTSSRADHSSCHLHHLLKAYFLVSLQWLRDPFEIIRLARMSFVAKWHLKHNTDRYLRMSSPRYRRDRSMVQVCSECSSLWRSSLPIPRDSKVISMLSRAYLHLHRSRSEPIRIPISSWVLQPPTHWSCPSRTSSHICRRKRQGPSMLVTALSDRSSDPNRRRGQW